MLSLRLIPLCLAFLLLTVVLEAVTPAPLFRDNAILQRNKPVPVWGTASAGEKVTVTFAGQTKTTTANADGRWSVTLDPLPANATPATLTLVGKNTITLSNILVGEVWLASGQSNMEWSVEKVSYDHTLDVLGSANPLIREIKIKLAVADAPSATTAFEYGGWRSASPATTGNFSAVAYHFARDIHALVGVPIGIVNSTWGATRAEAWTDPVTLAAAPFTYVQQEWEKTLADYPAKKAQHETAQAAWEQQRDAARAAQQAFTKPAPAAPWGPGHRSTPSGLYNAMIHPLAPYALRGVIWYQGEGNAEQHARYTELFSAMITGWRTAFAQGDFPFYWVQLANFGSPAQTNWAFLREAQTKTLALPATGQAISIDIGDVRDIHPRNKKDVGRRLARLALARDYGFTVIDSGPVFKTTERDGPGFRVTFEPHGGLRSPLNELVGFELAGADKVFRPAAAKIENNTVLVSTPAVPDPVAVRYAWRNAPLAGLFNHEGLPAVPFRTDNW